jgi:hypothetical protein
VTFGNTFCAIVSVHQLNILCWRRLSSPVPLSIHCELIIS